MRQFQLQQQSAGRLLLRLRVADRHEDSARAALLRLFGEAQPVDVEELGEVDGKLLQYSSEIEP